MRKKNRLNSCADKKAFATWKDAAHALKMLRRRDDVERGNLLSVYRCTFCPWFHFGHKSPAET